MRGIESEDIFTVVELHVTTKNGTYIYVFSDIAPLEDLGIIIHDLTQILLREGEVVIHAEFLLEQESDWSELGPEGE
jgi:hypothetical protein